MILLQKQKIHRIRTLHWRTDQMMSEALAQMDLTASQGCVMGYLSHRKDAPCPRDVEETFSMSHSCVSGILSRLEKKGFIEFRPDEEDRRIKRIYVLDKVRACHEHMHNTIRDIEERMTQGFTEEEKERFIEMLDRAITNMGGYPERPPRKEETK